MEVAVYTHAAGLLLSSSRNEKPRYFSGPAIPKRAAWRAASRIVLPVLPPPCCQLWPPLPPRVEVRPSPWAPKGGGGGLGRQESAGWPTRQPLNSRVALLGKLRWRCLGTDHAGWQWGALSPDPIQPRPREMRPSTAELRVADTGNRARGGLKSPAAWMFIAAAPFPEVFFFNKLGCNPEIRVVIPYTECFAVPFLRSLFSFFTVLCVFRETPEQRGMSFSFCVTSGLFLHSSHAILCPLLESCILLAKGAVLVPGEGEYWHPLPAHRPGLD